MTKKQNFNETKKTFELFESTFDKKFFLKEWKLTGF